MLETLKTEDVQIIVCVYIHLQIIPMCVHLYVCIKYAGYSFAIPAFKWGYALHKIVSVSNY